MGWRRATGGRGSASRSLRDVLAGGHAGELTNEPDGQLWIGADHVLEAMSRDHHQSHVLSGRRGDLMGALAEQCHLAEQITLCEGVEQSIGPVDATPRCDR